MTRAAAARDILAIPLFAELMAEMEKTYTDACVYAAATDDGARLAAATQVRAIRELRDNIERISKEDLPKPPVKPVA
ncbi:hypothetical protein O9X81_05245 [Agrobacterium salinitolerans]|uniref:hypothetical protein n=1 Tax=Agrobacterium salinitolerans TaxID=1183413 RepID=UPI0022B84A47|nr:hypothetical protein [Agrobacterium salinitolerans]MCZ7856012.1 hypothetical protein [Agrobacterium salinitolerans]